MVLEKLEELGIGYDSAPERFEPANPILVMIHGAGGNSQMWMNQTRGLRESFNILALDLPGHGGTPGPGIKEIRGYADWLMDVLKGLFSAPFFLMGHSMGGAIVQETASVYGDMLKGVILAATGARLQVAPYFLEGLKRDFEGTVDRMIGYAYGPQTERSIIKQGARIMKEAGQEVVYGDFAACDFHDKRNDLRRTGVPCLIVCGEEDKLTPPPLSMELHRAIPGSELEILPSCGHMLMIESPETFNRVVLDFCVEKDH